MAGMEPTSNSDHEYTNWVWSRAKIYVYSDGIRGWHSEGRAVLESGSQIHEWAVDTGGRIRVFE